MNYKDLENTSITINEPLLNNDINHPHYNDDDNKTDETLVTAAVSMAWVMGVFVEMATLGAYYFLMLLDIRVESKGPWTKIAFVVSGSLLVSCLIVQCLRCLHLLLRIAKLPVNFHAKLEQTFLTHCLAAIWSISTACDFVQLVWVRPAESGVFWQLLVLSSILFTLSIAMVRLFTGNKWEYDTMIADV